MQGLFGASLRLTLRAPFGREKSLQAIFSNKGFEPSPLSPPHIKKPLNGACLYVAEREGFEPSIRG